MPTCPKIAGHRMFYTIVGVVICLALLVVTVMVVAGPVLPPVYGTDY